MGEVQWARLSATELERRRELRSERRGGAAVAISIVVALLVHGGVVALLAPLMMAPQTPRAKTRVTMVSKSRTQRLKARAPQREAEKKEATKTFEEPPADKYAILEDSIDDAPENADHFASSNHTTERETEARAAQQKMTNVAPSPVFGSAKARVAARDGEKQKVDQNARASSPGGRGRTLAGAGRTHEDGEGARALAFEVPKQRPIDEIKLGKRDDGRLASRKRIEKLGEGRRLELWLGREPKEKAEVGTGRSDEKGNAGAIGSGDEKRPGLASLTPTLRELQSYTGAPVYQDLEVERDAQTRLNAWRWRHAVFYDRLQRSVRDEWRGLETYWQHDPTRAVYGTQDLVVVLHVRMDREGNFKEINVEESSGADFFDDEAYRTMKTVGGLSNPPVAMFKGEETYSFSFGFTLKNDYRDLDFDWKPY